MKYKIPGSISLVAALLGILFSSMLLPDAGVYGWLLFVAALFFLKLAINLFRKAGVGLDQPLHKPNPKKPH